MPVFCQAFLNQSLSRQLLRVAGAKYGIPANISTRTNKKARFSTPGLNLDLKSERFQQFRYFDSFATRLVRRDTFREPVFLCSTPLETPRMISGSAAFKAARAAVLSPDVMASSTLRIKPRTRVLRDVLMAVRLAVVRTRFLAEAILGMGSPWILPKRGARITPDGPGVNNGLPRPPRPSSGAFA